MKNENRTEYNGRTKPVNTIRKSGGIRTIVCTLVSIVLILTAMISPATATALTTTSYFYQEESRTHSSVFDGYILCEGADTSYYNGRVQWAKVKEFGLDYTIMRIGYRGSTEGGLHFDDYFADNYDLAEAAGVMKGVYFFTQATSVEEAIEEANYTLEILNGRHLELPIFLDVEYVSGGGRMYSASLSRRELTDIIDAFCATIEAANYTAGVYASLNFSNSKFYAEELAQKYEMWVAQYYQTNVAEYPYSFWQYTSDGTVLGSSKRTDLNYWYINPKGKGLLASADISFAGESYFQYRQGKPQEPQVRVSFAGTTLTEGVDYEVGYVNNCNSGTAYVIVTGRGDFKGYGVMPFTIAPGTDYSELRVSSVPDVEYTGSSRTPSASDLIVKDSLGRVLEPDRDYYISPTEDKNTKKIGTAYFDINYTCNYTGAQTMTYNIVKGRQEFRLDGEGIYEMDISRRMDDGDFDLGLTTRYKSTKVSYTSSDENVAQVDKYGHIKAIGVGTCVITGKAPGTSNYDDGYVTVNLALTNPQTVTTTYTKYTKQELDKAFNLNAKTNGGGEITYVSSDTSVAKVSSNGTVTVVGPGVAYITVTASGTKLWEEGSKVVTVIVDRLYDGQFETEEERLTAVAERAAVISDWVENTKITSLTYTSTRKAVTLSWKKSSSKYAFDDYQIWRSTNKSSGYTKIFTTTSGTKYSYKNSLGLKAGTTYWYKVRGTRYINGTRYYTPFTKICTMTKY